MKFLVYAPGDYTPNGGGCVALHKLAHNIASLGEESYIMTSKKNPDYLGIEVNEQRAKEIAKDDDCLVVYPEVICGNPLDAKKVMRWILYFVRERDCHGIFGKDDLIYKYAERFTLRHEQKVHGELRAMELNLDIFQDRKQPRSGSCHLYKKNPDKAAIHPPDSLRIDDYAQLGGNQYLSDIFNSKEIFYSYDSATWISIMAALCGCVSVVIPDDGVSALEWHEKFPYFKYGIAYGLDDLEHAKSNIHLLRDHLLKLEAETLEQTIQFIKTAKEGIWLI